MAATDEDGASAPSKEHTLVNETDNKSNRRHSVGEMAAEAMRKVEAVVLYAFQQAPPYQQDNHYILSGYRGELRSFKQCIQSLWYLHNESGSVSACCSLMKVNIWSHLLGAIGFGVLAGLASFSYLNRYPTSSSEDMAVFACFFGGAVMCLAFSASVCFF